MTLSLAACGNDAESAGATTNKTVQVQANVTKEENTAKETEETTTESTVEVATEPTEPPVEFVEPAAEDFEYNYDAALGGLRITKYTGEASAIRIPAAIDGEPVKQVSLNGNHSITQVEISDSVTSIGDAAFEGCDGLTVTYRGQEYNHASQTSWW